MKTTSRLIGLAAVFLLALFALGASAQKAEGEPTLAQIYQAANQGDLAKAQGMIDQVLEAHPNSAKAHYVKAELAARDSDFGRAREELSTAEKLAPGLPFAKAESVQALRTQITRPVGGSSGDRALSRQVGAAPNGSATDRSSPGFPWGTLFLVTAVVAVGVLVLRARAGVRARESYGGNYGGTAPYGQPGPMYPPNSGGTMMSPNATGYGQQPSMGSSIMRGLGTGLAVGAGAFAAQELGRRMFSHDGQPAAGDGQLGGNGLPSMDAIDEGMRRNLNTDMGGDNFGVADGGGWDNAASSGGDVGGGDWDA